MADEPLRELERRWRETASPDDEATFLRESVRSGRLDERRLLLAAYLGNAEAIRCTGESAPGEVFELGQMLYLLCAKNEPARECGVRALVATARFQLELPERGTSIDTLEAIQRLLHRLEEWCVAPSHATRRRIGRSLHAMNSSRFHGFIRRAGPTPRDYAARAARSAASIVSTTIPDEVPRIAANGIREGSGCTLRFPVPDGTLRGPDWVGGYSGARAEHPELRAAIVAEVMPWALGYADPMRDRIQARRREAADG